MFYIIEILDAHPFWDPYAFFYRNAMDNFLNQHKILPLTHCSQKMLNSQPRLSIYNKIFLYLHYICMIKSLILGVTVSYL